MTERPAEKDPEKVWGLSGISSYMGFHPDGRYVRKVHMEGLLEHGAVFKLPRKLHQTKYMGLKDRIVKYMTWYQRLNGRL